MTFMVNLYIRLFPPNNRKSLPLNKIDKNTVLTTTKQLNIKSYVVNKTHCSLNTVSSQGYHTFKVHTGATEDGKSLGL